MPQCMKYRQVMTKFILLNTGVCSASFQTTQEELRKSLINVALTEGMDNLETDVEWIPKKLKLMHYIRFSLLVKRQAFLQRNEKEED